jgi:hypothetical protein
MKYIFKQVDDISRNSAETTVEFSADTLSDVLQQFELFIRGCGFFPPEGNLDYVNDFEEPPEWNTPEWQSPQGEPVHDWTQPESIYDGDLNSPSAGAYTTPKFEPAQELYDEMDYGVANRPKNTAPWDWTVKELMKGPITTKDVERVVFTDKAIALDVVGPAGDLYALLTAGLGQADVTSTYMGIGLALQDTGKTDVELAQILLDSAVYKADALGVSNETFVKHVYKNVTGQTISLADLTVFTGWLDSKAWTQAQLLNAASDLVAFREVALVGLADTGIEYIPFAL